MWIPEFEPTRIKWNAMSGFFLKVAQLNIWRVYSIVKNEGFINASKKVVVVIRYHWIFFH